MTGLVAIMTKRIAGGHRVDTHSLLAVLLAAGGTWAMALVRTSHGVPIASIVLLAVTLALAIRGLIPRLLPPGHLIAVVVGGLLAYVIYRSIGLAWLPLAIGGGWLSHLVGDIVTSGGVPLLWPVSKRHFALPILDHTNSWRKRLAGVPLLAAVVVLARAPVSALIGPPPMTRYLLSRVFETGDSAFPSLGVSVTETSPSSWSVT
jgi:membrane-bound metal-dependent hydrolase YbcI (DUF457 family)